jgi:hypothetical protein
MGLDMYLEGEKFYWTDWEHPENNLTMDGFKITRTRLSLGYWRKHPDLHGFIVQTFAEGKDNCKDVYLSPEDIGTIMEAIQGDKLPHTEGFFFGATDGSEKAESLRIFAAALAWLTTKKEGVSRSVYYRASW